MTKLFGRTYTRRQLLDLVGDISQVIHTRRAKQIEGFEQGADLIDVFNASGLCFSVLPGRAMDIASAHYKGMSLCFRSGTGDVGPSFYEPQGFGWMRSFFGGLVTSCGMTFVGHPEIDPHAEEIELGLHGRLSNIPAASVVAEGDWSEDEYTVRLKGQMREVEPFLTNLICTREISTTLGHKSIRIHDRVENLGVDPSPLMMVYHTNPGFPLLDEGSRLVLNAAKSTEWLEDREVGPEVYTTVSAPQEEEHDDVYVHYPVADAEGKVHVGLINDKLQMGLTWRFPVAEMPILNQWQHFRRGSYVTGIEPGNCSVLGRAWNRKQGTLQFIEPDEVREFHLEIGVLDGDDEIAEFESLYMSKR